MIQYFSDPFETLLKLQRSLDAFRSSDWLSRGLSGGGSYPLLNVFRKGDDLVVITELPGLKRDDIDVQVHGKRLRISGRKTIDYGEEASLHRRERLAGTFDRTVALPVEIDAANVKAEYRNGVLALLLPRAERDKPKSIAIN